MWILANVLSLALIAADGIPSGGSEPTVMPKITKPGNSVNPEPDVLWKLELSDAIRIGLEKSPVVRMMAPGGEITPGPINAKADRPRWNHQELVIAPSDGDASLWPFKSALMAHVRSIEQQYWALSMTNVVLQARETALKIAEEILRSEQAKLAEGRANSADIAEAEQQVENFKLNLVSATSDVITTERQLRNILGLTPADNRRIVPATAPSERRIDPVWEVCLARMTDAQPDLARLRQAVTAARLKGMVEAQDPAQPAERKDANDRELKKQEQALEQATHQATHALARFFLEVDANYKQFQTARTLLESARKRLESQRAFYEEGKVTVDRLLDAVSQHANAVATESQYLSTYNTAIAALEEAKGTLLSYDGILISPPSARSKPAPPVRDERIAPVAFEPPVTPQVQVPTTMPVPTLPTLAPAPNSPTTYKLRAKLGLLKVLEVELEVVPGASR